MRLEDVRGRIRAIDAEIVRLVGDRVQAAVDAGRVKRAAGLPIRDYDAERAVVDAMRQGVAERHVDPELGERVARLLIEASLRIQESDGAPRPVAGRLGHALVVGGAGAMGSWFARFLNDRGWDVSVADPRGAPDGFPHVADAAAAALEADLTVVAVPPDATGPVLASLAEGRGLLVDVASIKSPFMPTLRELARTRPVASIHPLWGPSTRVLSGKNVLVLDCGHPDATNAAAALFHGTAARVHRLPVEEHDALVAYTLGVPHALNLVFAEVLMNHGVSFDAMRRGGGPTFLKQSAVAAEVASENREMYRQIQAGNAATGAVYEALATAMRSLRERIHDPDAFARRMDEYDTYFARFKEWWP